MNDCPTEAELIASLDGEATRNADARTRAHLRDCRRCQETWSELEAIVAGLGAPLPAVDVDRAVAEVLRRIEHAPPSTVPARRGSARRWGPALVLSVAAAAGIAFAASRTRAPSENDRTFASRGGGPLSLRQAVRVTFQREGAALHRLESGESVAKDAKLTVSYRNARDREPAYLLAFVIDSDHAVHWVFPAYEHAGENPASVVLAPSPGESLMSTAVVLEEPSHGPARLVSVVSSAPHHVAEIESLPPEALSPDALRARFHDDVIDETTVSFP